MINWTDILADKIEKLKSNQSIKPKKSYLLPVVPTDTISPEEFNKLIKSLTGKSK